MFYDLRHSVRAVGRAKGTTAVILLSLGLGTGANAAVYSVLDRLLLRYPAGIDSPSELVSLYTSEYSGFPYGLSSYPDVISARQSGSLSALALIQDGLVENARLGEIYRSVRIAEVSDDYFSALGMEAQSGQLRTSEGVDAATAVISLSLAEQVGASDVVGKLLTIGRRSYIVAGVTTPRFRGLQVGRDCDVWVPMGTRSAGRGNRRYTAIGRLTAGVGIEEARRDLERISIDLGTKFPQTNRGTLIDPSAPRRITVVPYSRLDPTVRSQAILIGFVIGGASTLLLASACLNVGGLLLSWAVARRREFAIKMALGATREMLVRQLLMETLCVAAAGGALGALFAMWTAQIVPSLFMMEEAALLDTRINAQTFVLTIGVACVAGAVFGVAPALHGTASSPASALRADSGGVANEQGGRRLRGLFVSGQVALSTVLLLMTGVLVMTLERALEGDVGAMVRQVAVVSMELPGRFDDPLRGIRVRDMLLERIPQVRGVVRVGWASTLPLGRGNNAPFQVEGETSDVVDTPDFDANVVSSGFFDVLSLKLVEGRVFDDGDTPRAAPVVVVDELLARRHFGATVIGRHLVDGRGTRLEIVGVVRSGRYRTLQQPPRPTVYYPSSQDYLWRGYLVVRTSPDPALVLDDIRAAVNKAAGDAGVLRITTLKTHVAESLSIERLTTTLVFGCGLIALSMSAMGVYGIMIDAVNRRTREIGLRVALGAAAPQVARLVLMEAAYPAVSGLLIGGAAALAVTRLASNQLSGLPPFDFTWLAAAAAALAALIALAAVFPLLHALRVDPNTVLRAE
jgi:putative ABC transport system permease protein